MTARKNGKPNGAGSSRNARIIESQRLACRERAVLSKNYRRRLMAELKIDNTFAQSMLIDTAVSAAVEVTVLTRRFLMCRITATDLERLAKVRGQLARLLAQLTGASKNGDSEPNAPPTLEAWLQDWRAREKPQDGPIPPQRDPTEVQP
jgi:hypothetical protein